MDLFPAYRPTVPGMQQSLVERFGDLPQVMDDATSLTFRDVDRQSAILARGLLARGLGKGARVGLLLPNGPEWATAWFAITRMGAIAVQLSTFGAARELAHVIRHADVQLLITADRFLSHDYLERLPTALPGLADSEGGRPLQLRAAPFLREIWVFGEAPAWARGDRAGLEAAAADISSETLSAVEAEVHPSDAAVMIYTSGSTSDPKAVVHSHGVVTRHSHVMSRYMTYGRGDRLLSVSPMFWVGGLCTSMLAANQSGAACVTPRTQSPADVVRTIRGCQVTHAFLAAPKARALYGVDGFDEAELRRLKPSTATQQFVYGLTPKELTPDSLGMSETFGPHSMEFAGERLPPDKTGSFGRGVRRVERKIIRAETGEELPAGELGELCVRGYSLMDGYYKRERAESFDSDGWFHTGDLCSISEDGYLFFHGRSGEMLKTSGANVSPREVELVLLEYPDIADAAVVGLPHPKMGQMVVAAVVLRPGRVMDEGKLRGWLQGQLSSFKVPKRFVPMDAAEIPRTDTGKIRKAELQARLEQLAGEAS